MPRSFAYSARAWRRIRARNSCGPCATSAAGGGQGSGAAHRTRGGGEPAARGGGGGEEARGEGIVGGKQGQGIGTGSRVHETTTKSGAGMARAEEGVHLAQPPSRPRLVARS